MAGAHATTRAETSERLWLLPLAALAAEAALAAPSGALARRSDLVLAALVLFTALAIGPAQLAALPRRKREVAALALPPFVVLAQLPWLVSRLFSGPVRDGTLALRVSSTEIAAVGLVALSGESAVLALGALAGSLVVSALVGPVVLGALSGAASDVAVGALVAQFALVVLSPLALGLLVRAPCAPRARGRRACGPEHRRRRRARVRRDELGAGGGRAARRRGRRGVIPRRIGAARGSADGARTAGVAFDRHAGHRAARLRGRRRAGGAGLRTGGRDRGGRVRILTLLLGAGAAHAFRPRSAESVR